MSDTYPEASRAYHECVAVREYARGIEAIGALIDGKGVGVHQELSLRSSLHSLAGDHARALADLDRAIEMAPGHGALYHDRGELHRRNGAYRLALRDYSEAVLLAHAAGDDGLIDAVEHFFIAILEDMRTE
jgi:tetratricopeptide (TPR) repeat protein